MAFKLLTQEEQDEMLAQTLKAQEVDLYMHGLNKERYERMLPELQAGEFKTRVESLLAQTTSRISEVTAIIAALDTQLPDAERLAAANERVKARDASAKAVSQ